MFWIIIAISIRTSSIQLGASLAAGLCSEAKEFTSSITNFESNPKLFGCQDQTGMIEMCEYSGVVHGQFTLSDEDILSLHESCFHRNICTIPQLTTNGRDKWQLRITYRCAGSISLAAGVCLDGKEFTSSITNFEPNPKTFECQNQNSAIELCDYSGMEQRKFSLSDEDILSLHESCSHRNICAIPKLTTSGREKWHLRITYRCSEWTELCSDFNQVALPVDLIHTKEPGAKGLECVCDVSGKFAIDFVDVRLNYNRELCSSSNLRIAEKSMCSTTKCLNKTYSCTNISDGQGPYFLKTMYETEQALEMTLSLTTSTCPANMIWIKLSTTGIVNVAFGKTVTMSSIYDSTVHGKGDGKHAVDGEKSGDWKSSGHPCASTDIEMNPWLLLNLEKIYPVTGIQIVNRRDIPVDRLKDLTIEFGSAVEKLTRVWVHRGVVPFVKNITFNQTYTGQYFRFSMNAFQYLTICEIEVYALPSIRCSKKEITGPVEDNRTCSARRYRSVIDSSPNEQIGGLSTIAVALTVALCVLVLAMLAIVLGFIRYRRQKKREVDKIRRPGATADEVTHSYRRSANYYSDTVQNNAGVQLHVKSSEQTSQHSECPTQDKTSDIQSDYYTIRDSQLCSVNKNHDEDDHYYSIKDGINNEYNETKVASQMPDNPTCSIPDIDENKKEENPYDHLNARRPLCFGSGFPRTVYDESEIQTVDNTKDMLQNTSAKETIIHLLTDDKTEKQTGKTDIHAYRNTSNISPDLVNEVLEEKQDLGNVDKASRSSQSTNSLDGGDLNLQNEVPTTTKHPYYILEKSRLIPNNLSDNINPSLDDKACNIPTSIMNDKNPQNTYFEITSPTYNEKNEHNYSDLELPTDSDTKTKDFYANVHDYLQLEDDSSVEQSTVRGTPST